MRLHHQTFLCGLAAAFVLAVAVAVSSAATYSLGPESFSARWTSLTFELGGNRVACPVTLEGSFSSATFPATAGTRVGTINRASLGTCSAGSATILSETLPWTVQYATFAGTLPNITSLTFHVIGAATRGSVNGLTCLIRSMEAHPLNFIAERLEEGSLTGTRVDESLGIPASGGFLCELAGEAHASGRGSFGAPGGAATEILEGRGGTDLVASTWPPEQRLDPVAVRLGSEVLLGMTNRGNWLIWLERIELTGPNARRYELEPAVNLCIPTRTELIRARENECRLAIRRNEGAGDTTVRIEFRYPDWFFGFWMYSEEFTVLAIP
jgi:hypothetical protein